MIVNELKPLLGDNWKEKFVHRDLWDPDGYGVASFDLGGDREKVLAMNLETEDIMEYFYDDLPDDEWISLEFLGYKNREINLSYKLQTSRKIIDLWSYRVYSRHTYPIVSLRTSNTEKKSLHIHKIVARVFVPNPYPEQYSIINHIDLDKTNFNKENLEWCDAKWNSKFRLSTIRKASYKNLLTGEVFTTEYLIENGILKDVQQSIYKNKKFLDTFWEPVDTALEDYLSRHPLQDDWYQHPTMPNVRANGCGVLEIDGKLKVGSFNKGSVRYELTIKDHFKNCPTHRILCECYFSSKLTDKDIVDHIVPVSLNDIDNSVQNLRITDAKGNSTNPLTLVKFQKSVSSYDLKGNFIKKYDSIKMAKEEVGVETLSPVDARRITAAGRIWASDEKYLFEKLEYIYYRWKLSDAGAYIEAASTNFNSVYKKSEERGKMLSESSVIKRKYLNTGMPAPDGYYYQQGDPQHMIYDPENTSLEKKRPEIFWKDRNKNNNKEGNQ